MSIPSRVFRHHYGSREPVLTFDLDLESSKDKERSVVNNIGRALVAKKTLSLGSTELEVIENCDIFDIYKDLYLTKISVKTCTCKVFSRKMG